MLALLAALLTAASAQQAADAFLEKGDQYIATGKPSLARVEYEKALKAGAKLDGDFSRSRNLGLAYLNGSPHDFNKAVQWLSNASRLRSGDDEVRLALAQALTWSGKPNDAVPQWRDLWTRNRQDMDYALGLANALWASGNKQACFDHLQHLVENYPSNLQVRLEYARLLGYEKNYAEASVQYQSVLQIDPTNLDAQVGMAKLLSWQESYDAALTAYDAVLKRSPRNYAALVGKAYTQMWMGRNEDALKTFQLAARQNPRDPEVEGPLKKLTAEADRIARQNAAATAASRPAPAQQPAVATNKVPEPPVPQPAPAEPEPTPAPAPAPAPAVDAFKDLMNSGEAAANRSDFQTAIADYRKALELKPNDADANIRLARVLSWAKKYDESLATYARVVDETHQRNTEARIERARVLSWAQRYDESIHEYQALADELHSQPVPGVSEREIHLELARVESWARKYDASLAELNKLIPEKPTVEDRDPLLLKARVLSYKRSYPQSLATYDRVLALDAKDKDARFGKAQVLYWSGDLRHSRPMLRQVVNDEPGNTDARLTLAAVENGSGDSVKALSLLKSLPDSGEVHQLRTAIEQAMRPILRERFGWENDIEQPPSSSQPSTTTRGLRLMSSIEFSAMPNLRLEISNTLTRGTTSNPTLARYGFTAFAQETMVRATLRPTQWFHLVAGIGVGTTGAGSVCPQFGPGACTATGDAGRTQRPVFDVHPVFTWNKLRIDLGSSRHVADYTPLAIHDNVVQLRQSAAISYDARHVRFGGEYRYLNYRVEPSDLTPGLPSNLSANSHGGLIYATPKLYTSDRLTIEAGARYEAFGYDHGAEQIAQSIPTGYGTAGFFTPKTYERVAATGHIAFNLGAKFHAELDGTFGPQRIFGFASLTPPPAKWGATGTTTAQLRRDMGRFQPYIAYDFFTTATAAGPSLTSGSYSSHSINGGFSWRF